MENKSSIIINFGIICTWVVALALAIYFFLHREVVITILSLVAALSLTLIFFVSKNVGDNRIDLELTKFILRCAFFLIVVFSIISLIFVLNEVGLFSQWTQIQ